MSQVASPTKKTSGILRSVASLASAGVVAQLLSFLVLPIVGRIYPKEAIGLAGVVMTYSTLLSLLASGNYGQAIVIAKPYTSRILLRAALLYSFSFSLIIALFFVFFSGFIVSIIPPDSSFHQVVAFRYWIPIIVFLLTAFMALSGFANQHRKYDRLSLAFLLQSLSVNGLKIGLGLWRAPIASSLVFSSASGGGIATLSLLPKKDTLRGRVTWKRMRKLLAYYKNFPLYSAPTMLVHALAHSQILVLLPRWYDLATIGLITMAMQLANTPLVVLNNSFSRVYCKDFAEKVARKQPLLPSFLRYMRYYIAIVPLGFVLLFFLMPKLVNVVLGSRWVELVPIIRFMLPYLALHMPASIFNFLPELFKKQRQLLIAYVIIFVYQLLLIILIASQSSFEQFYSLYFLLSAFIPILFLLWLFTFILRYDKKLK